MHAYVNSAVRAGDSCKTKNADDGKAKSRDTRATNCESGTRDQRTSSYLRFLVGVAMHPWVSRTSVFLAGHFTQSLDKTYAHVMNRACIDPTLSLTMPPTTQLRLAPSDNHHLSSITCYLAGVLNDVYSYTATHQGKHECSKIIYRVMK